MRFTFVRAQDEKDRCAKSNCPYEKVEHTDFCPRHGANKQLEKKAKEMGYQFKLERVRNRLDLLVADPKRYRLDEELGLMRITLEDTINAITTRAEDKEYALFAASDTIRNLVNTIEKLAQTCVTQSRSLGLLMTADEVLEQVQKIIDVIAEELDDEETVIRIADRISVVLGIEGPEIQSNGSPIKLGLTAPTDRESEE